MDTVTTPLNGCGEIPRNREEPIFYCRKQVLGRSVYGAMGEFVGEVER